MKIRVVVTLDVDPDAWVLNYGEDRRAIHGDVKMYIENLVREQLTDVGVLRDETD